MAGRDYDYGLLKSVGRDVFINTHVDIRRPNLVVVGDHVAVDWGFVCTTQMILGDRVHIGPHVTVIGGARARFECHGFNNIMAGARIVCGSDRFDGSGLPGTMIPGALRGREIIEPVTVEKFANVGTNAVILPGSRLRQGVLITAGSLFMGDSEEWGVYKGNPAVLVKRINPQRILETAGTLEKIT